MKCSTFLSFLALTFPFASATPARRHHEIAHRARADADVHKRSYTDSRFTFYDDGLGACGEWNGPTDHIVALNSYQFGSGYPGPNCFKNITITYNGASINATITDRCEICPYGGLDFSRGLFDFFASETTGVLYGDWSFLDEECFLRSSVMEIELRGNFVLDVSEIKRRVNETVSPSAQFNGNEDVSAKQNECTVNRITGIYNSSVIPSDLPWNTYNYCNAPHVNSQHYPEPEDPQATLEYMNVVIRHHKRTPDNLYPDEQSLNPTSGWNCDHIVQQDYAAGTAPVYHQTVVPEWHPFASQIWLGTCDAGQLTREGLEDAVKHGQDFWSVYHDALGFLDTVDPRDIHVRTSTEVRTHQVAGAILYGMDPNTIRRQWPIYTQPQNIDSLVPNYGCPNADAIRAAYQSVPAWTDHLVQHQDLQQQLDTTLGTTGLSAWNSWYDHFFDTFASRTCHGRPLPCNATGSCVSQEDADTVFALGDWEYNYIWNSAQNASTYTSLTFGVFFTELLHNFQRFRSSEETHKLRFYVGHDGSMIRLAAGLGLGHTSNGGALRWPAMGSEIVMEVWRDASGGRFVRVIHEGTPVPSLRWVQLGEFIGLLNDVIPDDVYRACTE